MPEPKKPLARYQQFFRHVLVDDLDGIKVITLRRPEARLRFQQVGLHLQLGLVGRVLLLLFLGRIRALRLEILYVLHLTVVCLLPE